MQIKRFFTTSGQSPYTGIDFTARESQITGKGGEVIFSNTVVVPSFWSDTAATILAQKYFRRKGVDHTHPNSLYNSKYSKQWHKKEASILKNDSETDLRQTIHRLVGCWTFWGEKHNYFDSENAQTFYDELSYMLARQMFAPNSPQWFNTGLHWAYGIEGKPQGHFYCDPDTGVLTESKNAYEHVQASACFINSVEDDLVNPGGIFDLFLREARLFKHGSGAGGNVSALRGENEPLSGGGKSSGLMSWLKHGDTGAGSVKSGGTTRRAALMRILNTDHPDIEKFINWKVTEEQKVVALAIGSQRMKAFGDDLLALDPAKASVSDGPDSGLKSELKKLVLKAKKEGIPNAFIQQCLLRYQEGDTASGIPTYDLSWDGEGYQSVSGMNSNNSVRVTDAFMRAVEKDEPWDLLNRTGGVAKTTLLKSVRESRTVVFETQWCPDLVHRESQRVLDPEVHPAAHGFGAITCK
jgi:ribonucleoside-diphosphate reductase alpha chain